MLVLFMKHVAISPINQNKHVAISPINQNNTHHTAVAIEITYL